MIKNLLLATMLSIFTAGQVSAQSGQQSISLTTDIPVGDTLRVVIEHVGRVSATGVDPLYYAPNDTTFKFILTSSSVTISANQIKWFHCDNQMIRTLDVSRAGSLQHLECGNNLISSLDLSSNTALNTLNCSGNTQLRGTLDLSANTNLVELGCTQVPITTLVLPSYGSNLETLWLSSCHNLTGLDVSNIRSLKTLGCNYMSSLASLMLSNNTNLEYLYCSNSSVTSINTSNLPNLRELWCNDNPGLNTLNVTNMANLTDLYCSNCNLSQLSVANCTSLERLFCQHNQIDATALTNLINSLPYHQPTPENLELYEFCYYDNHAGQERNEYPTNAQISSCYNRGWTPKYVVFDTGIQYPVWTPYPQPNRSFNAMKPQRGQTTEIRSIADIDNNDHALWYDMQGRCVSKPTHSGLYIHKGKKIFIK